MKKIVFILLGIVLLASCGREKLIIPSPELTDDSTIMIVRKVKYLDDNFNIYILNAQDYRTESNCKAVRPVFIADKGLYTVGDTVRIEFR